MSLRNRAVQLWEVIVMVNKNTAREWWSRQRRGPRKVAYQRLTEEAMAGAGC